MDITMLDGGTATEMVRLGETWIDTDPLWSARALIEKPAVVKVTHINFLEAGSDVIVTASYQASVEGFQKHAGLSHSEALNCIRSSVSIAREACREYAKADPGGGAKMVAASVGPYGACQHDGSEYTGSYVDRMTIEDLMAWHRPRMKALLEGGPDFIAIETIPALKEAEAILKLLQEFPDSKAWISFSCKDGQSLCHGEQFSDAVKAVVDSPVVVAVGVNCTAPEYVSSLLQSIAHLNVQKPILVKPNSGESWESGKGFYGKEFCLNLETMVTDWIRLGARWIGGCCRVYPDDIRRLKERIKDGGE